MKSQLPLTAIACCWTRLSYDAPLGNVEAHFNNVRVQPRIFCLVKIEDLKSAVKKADLIATAIVTPTVIEHAEDDTDLELHWALHH